MLRGRNAHSHELHIATNCLRPFLLIMFPLFALLQTTKSSPEASVPVVLAPGIFEKSDVPGGLSLAELASGHFPRRLQPQLRRLKNGELVSRVEV